MPDTATHPLVVVLSVCGVFALLYNLFTEPVYTITALAIIGLFGLAKVARRA